MRLVGERSRRRGMILVTVAATPVLVVLLPPPLSGSPLGRHTLLLHRKLGG